VQDVECIADLAGGDRVLVQVAGGARILRAADVTVVARAGVDDDVLVGVERANEARRLDTVTDGHRQVHDDDVRPMLARELDGLVARARTADHHEAIVVGQERRDQLGQLVVVLGNDDRQGVCPHQAGE
jgi:hypothetical protein